MIKLVQKKSVQPHLKPENSNAAISSVAPAYLRFAKVYDLVSDGIRIVDKDFNILYLNRTFRALTKPGNEVNFGAKCYDVFKGCKCHTDRCPLEQLRSGEKEIRLTCKAYKLCSYNDLATM